MLIADNFIYGLDALLLWLCFAVALWGMLFSFMLNGLRAHMHTEGEGHWGAVVTTSCSLTLLSKIWGLYLVVIFSARKG